MTKWFMRKSDRNNVIIYILVVLAAATVLTLLKGEDEKNGDRRNTTAGTRRGNDRRQGHTAYFAQPEREVKLQRFDPNTADSTTLLALGLPPWQVRNIYKYRAKGGRYRTKEDFSRVYGLTIEKYRQLEPYITIKPEVMAADVIKLPTIHKRDYKTAKADDDRNATTAGVHKLRFGEKIDINTADTAMLKTIPGIGTYFAMRIVELRTRRQAFASVDELLAIRNFPETALTYMYASQDFPELHVNRLNVSQLCKHPLVNYTQARDIMQLRRTTGAIRSAKDLSFISSFTPEQLQRLAPCLRFD